MSNHRVPQRREIRLLLRVQIHTSMTKIDTAVSEDANSFCCNAINLTIVALSCEPDLPCAFGNHHEQRC
ncbi:hypothetical protein DEO72_LG4g1204 [Vigna unguiculata]|uniref:Uncharacterized protein n=1 Tax=Vigna unguiculata TaxID=3917 RepID=A0A4D6LN51_VIGUN|nr:hypothetical protein DEO72_LG4g1204 [Vigna unguiculata]